MVFGYLKRKIWGEDIKSVQQNLDFSFSKVDHDIAMIKVWLTHLSNRSVSIDDKHSSHDREIALTKKDIDDIRAWIQHLYIHNNELKRKMGDTASYLSKIDEQHRRIAEKLAMIEKKIAEQDAKMAQGQVGTLHGTSQGQVRDMRNDEKIEKKYEIPEKREVLEKPKLIQRAKQMIGIDKNSLTGAEIEIVNLLYHVDRPLSYEEIANRVGKKEKSIRNIICEIRRKGIDVLDKPVGLREKGFFLSKEAKLSVSGR